MVTLFFAAEYRGREGPTVPPPQQLDRLHGQLECCASKSLSTHCVRSLKAQESGLEVPNSPDTHKLPSSPWKGHRHRPSGLH